jgi:hypothetical protein
MVDKMERIDEHMKTLRGVSGFISSVGLLKERGPRERFPI